MDCSLTYFDDVAAIRASLQLMHRNEAACLSCDSHPLLTFLPSRTLYAKKQHTGWM